MVRLSNPRPFKPYACYTSEPWEGSWVRACVCELIHTFKTTWYSSKEGQRIIMHKKNSLFRQRLFWQSMESRNQITQSLSKSTFSLPNLFISTYVIDVENSDIQVRTPVHLVGNQFTILKLKFNQARFQENHSTLLQLKPLLRVCYLNSFQSQIQQVEFF